MSSTSNQIGASIGTAILSTIAAGATASFAGSGGQPAALVHGFTTAMFIGSVVVFVGAIVVGSLVDANPARKVDVNGDRHLDAPAR